ncbi:MAG: DUF3127 domain-containing protein [Coriobacteriia bacterium]
MDLEFTGLLSQINETKFGETAKGDWAKAEFEVTESNPKNEKYPQIAIFDYFKNGEHAKMAKDFDKKFKVGDEVTVKFNLNKTVYTKKDGSEGTFYKTSAWMVSKTNNNDNSSNDTSVENINVVSNDDDDLPF